MAALLAARLAVQLVVQLAVRLAVQLAVPAVVEVAIRQAMRPAEAVCPVAEEVTRQEQALPATPQVPAFAPCPRTGETSDEPA